jgi:hypothetical protein
VAERAEPAGGSNPPERVKMLFSFTKGSFYRFMSHLDLMGLFVKMGRRAGIPFSYSEGFNPKPRLSLPFALPLGIESEYEIGEVTLRTKLDEERFVETYNGSLPGPLRVIGACVTAGKKSAASGDSCHDYEVSGSDPAPLCDLLRRSVPVEDEITGKAESYVCRMGEKVFIRLAGTRSVKKLFEENGLDYTQYSIRRIMMWRLDDGDLVPFIAGSSS